MNLFIRVKDGLPIDHPILESNFLAAFPSVDIDDLPSNFARFLRIPVPLVGVYEVYEGVTYEWNGNVVQDVHHLRPMTAEEKAQKQTDVKNNWVASGELQSWLFDEATCSFVPPVAYPNDGSHYRWDEDSVSWVLLP